MLGARSTLDVHKQGLQAAPSGGGKPGASKAGTGGGGGDDKEARRPRGAALLPSAHGSRRRCKRHLPRAERFAPRQDQETARLRGALGGAILTEKPNVKARGMPAGRLRGGTARCTPRARAHVRSDAYRPPCAVG